jgi:hypothetical protein
MFRFWWKKFSNMPRKAEGLPWTVLLVVPDIALVF